MISKQEPVDYQDAGYFGHLQIKVFLWGQFCDVDEVAIIHKTI
jgi:hypothetical protein